MIKVGDEKIPPLSKKAVFLHKKGVKTPQIRQILILVRRSKEPGLPKRYSFQHRKAKLEIRLVVWVLRCNFLTKIDT